MTAPATVVIVVAPTRFSENDGLFSDVWICNKSGRTDEGSMYADKEIEIVPAFMSVSNETRTGKLDFGIRPLACLALKTEMGTMAFGASTFRSVANADVTVIKVLLTDVAKKGGDFMMLMSSKVSVIEMASLVALTTPPVKGTINVAFAFAFWIETCVGCTDDDGIGSENVSNSLPVSRFNTNESSVGDVVSGVTWLAANGVVAKIALPAASLMAPASKTMNDAL